MTTERYEALEKMIQNGRAAYNLRLLDGEEIARTVEIYEAILAAVPTGALAPLFEDTAKAKRDGFMPTAKDLLAEWQRPLDAQRDASQSTLQRTYHEEMGLRTAEEENARVARFQESERRRRALSAQRNRDYEEAERRGELPVVNTAVKLFPFQSVPSFHTTFLPTVPISPAPAAKPSVANERSIRAVPDDEMTDAELSQVLMCRCGMTKVPRERRRAFARYLLSLTDDDGKRLYPTHTWTPQLGQEKMIDFLDEQGLLFEDDAAVAQ